MIKKLFITNMFFLLLLTGCSNLFSSYRTVYRIETKNGERYYSDNKPSLDKSKNIYLIEDLDGNQYNIKQDLIYKIEKYKNKK